MGYIENNLMNDEELVHMTRLHPIILIGPAMLASFLSGTLAIFRDEPIVAIPLAITLLFVGIRLTNRIVKFVTTEFGITSKRVLGKTGFIKRQATDIVLLKVEAVRLNQNILGRLLNYGTIEVTGSGGTEEKLTFIPDPLKFRNEIQEQLSGELETKSDVTKTVAQ
jgi:uncharacterized membrane protein YdbT with pleckstrin-like domain